MIESILMRISGHQCIRKEDISGSGYLVKSFLIFWFPDTQYLIFWYSDIPIIIDNHLLLVIIEQWIKL